MKSHFELYRYKGGKYLIRFIFSRAILLLPYFASIQQLPFLHSLLSSLPNFPFSSALTYIRLSIYFSLPFPLYSLSVFQLCQLHSITSSSTDILLFFNLFQSEQFYVRLLSGKHNVSELPRWALEYPDDNTKKLVAVIQCNASRQKHSAVPPGFRWSDDSVLRQFGSQQVRQVLQASTATCV